MPGKLTTIRLIKQPKNSSLCGAACIGMVLKYYAIEYGGLEEVWENISDQSPNGRRYCKTYKIGKHLEEKGLKVSIVKYLNLDVVLKYCQVKQIPAIMNHHSFQNPEMGHFTVFIRQNVKSIVIRDPENENRVSVNKEELEQSFIKTNEIDEISGNIIIIPYKEIEKTEKYICKKCGKVNEIDSGLAILENGINSLICSGCDSVVEINKILEE